MLKAVEDINATKKRLMIEIPSEAIEKEIQASLEKVRQKANIPGYRTGKTPMNIIEKRFGKSVETEALEKIIPEFYAKAVKEADIVPITSPVLDASPDFQRNIPLSLAMVVEVLPKIETLNYKNIKIKDTPVSVTDKDFEKALKALQEQKTTYEPSSTPIKSGDLVTVDYEIKYDDQIQTAQDQAIRIGVEGMPKEITESLIGKKSGDTADVQTIFPDDFHMKQLAGKNVSVKNVVKTVKNKNLPAIDDEFAKDMGYEDMEKLNAALREQLETAKKEQIKKLQQDELIEKLVASHEFSIPEALLHRELSSLVAQAKVSQKSSKDTAELEAELQPQAEKAAKAVILISIIGEKESISVSDDELKQQLMESAERVSMHPESLMKLYIQADGSLEGFRNSIFRQKVLDLVLANAAIEKGEKS